MDLLVRLSSNPRVLALLLSVFSFLINVLCLFLVEFKKDSLLQAQGKDTKVLGK